MIQLKIDRKDVEKAEFLAKEMGKIKNSITAGLGNSCGFLGEIALAKFLEIKVDYDRKDFRNHDLFFHGYTIEVKTKRRTHDPKDNWEVSVAQTSSHQKPDIYAFMSITYDGYTGKGRERVYGNPQKIWLCGFFGAEKYMKEARFIKKGSFDSSNNFRAHVSMFNMSISSLSENIDKIL